MHLRVDLVLRSHLFLVSGDGWRGRTGSHLHGNGKPSKSDTDERMDGLHWKIIDRGQKVGRGSENRVFYVTTRLPRSQSIRAPCAPYESMTGPKEKVSVRQQLAL